MEKVLSQEEIDAMIQSARTGQKAGAPPTARVEPWDIKRAGQIGREQLLSINSLHEGFARNLTNSLGAYLRVVFAASLVSAEHLTYREFLQSIPETTYFASCRLDPIGVNAALQLDLKVAFPIIDVLLGGEGKSLPTPRELTEIEEQIMDSVARIICRDLGAAWQALALQIVFEQRLDLTAARRLMTPQEKTLSLSFEITMPEVRGGLNLAVPATVSNALLRKIAADWHPSTRRSGNSRQQIMRRLLEANFLVELGATALPAPVSELSTLTPGKVLKFPRSTGEPAILLVAGREMFHAMPARAGNVRAARVLARIPENDDSIAGESKGQPRPEEKTK
jgi:flagellar motor switch protein FliM